MKTVRIIYKKKQLAHNLASLLLKMQSVLHIPESSAQEVIYRLMLNKYSDMDERVVGAVRK